MIHLKDEKKTHLFEIPKSTKEVTERDKGPNNSWYYKNLANSLVNIQSDSFASITMKLNKRKQKHQH